MCEEHLSDIKKTIDTLIENFKYVSDVCLDLVEFIPEESFQYFKKRILRVQQIYQQYWAD